MNQWYTWSSQENFGLWHAAACASLGIPHPGYNEATGEVDEHAQWTTAYTSVVEVTVDDWRAFVEESVAVLVPDGLGTPSEAPPSPPSLLFTS